MARVERFDVAVIGGGVTGLGIARHAARNGITCIVLDRGDLASGASSASSHLLHGGLRYLEHGQFRLVREGLAERAAVTRMAPALASPRRFLVPLYTGDRIGRWRLHAGLGLYDWLAGRSGFERHRMLHAADLRSAEPGIARDGLVGAGAYTDVVMDDARLAIAVARDAARHGATLLTYHDVRTARVLDSGAVELSVVDRLDDGERRLVARALVNATGAWTDELRAALLPGLRPQTGEIVPLLRPSRGIHLVYPALTREHGFVLLARSDGRVFFVVPFGTHSLVGTTEIETDSPPGPEAWEASPAEVRYLREELARVLPATRDVPPSTVFSGIRPLLRSPRRVGNAPREHVVLEESPLVSVAGGKYTSFRAMARDTLARIAPRIGHTGDVHDSVDMLPEPLADTRDVDQVARFATDEEFARRALDVVRRRTTLWLEPDRALAETPRVAAAMGRRLGWSPGRVQTEIADCEASLLRSRSLLDRSG